MQKGPPNRDRKVVPRWRPLGKTPRGELLSANRRSPSSHDGLSELQRLKDEWATQPTIGIATDLLPLALALDQRDLAGNVSSFVLAQRDVPVLLGRIANEVIHGARDAYDVVREPAMGIPFYRAKITLAKKQLDLYPRNAIYHVDAARLYASLGQIKKARKHFRMALALAPTNRFVVRAAARFFVHTHEIDRALWLFRNAPRNDPWIVATQIAIADLADSKDVWASQGRVVLDRDLPPGQVTELAASLATLETKSGARRRANKLFRKAATSPNDNSVAQLHWAHEANLTEFDER